MEQKAFRALHRQKRMGKNSLVGCGRKTTQWAQSRHLKMTWKKSRLSMVRQCVVHNTQEDQVMGQATRKNLVESELAWS